MVEEVVGITDLIDRLQRPFTFWPVYEYELSDFGEYAEMIFRDILRETPVAFLFSVNLERKYAECFVCNRRIDLSVPTSVDFVILRSDIVTAIGVACVHHRVKIIPGSESEQKFLRKALESINSGNVVILARNEETLEQYLDVEGEEP